MNTSQGQADERMMQLLRLLNRLLERSPEARRRNLAWYTPIIVPVWPQVCVAHWAAGIPCKRGWSGAGPSDTPDISHPCLRPHHPLPRCTTQVRLFEEDPSSCSYNEAYETNCAR
jgi:hypothetical protein